MDRTGFDQRPDDVDGTQPIRCYLHRQGSDRNGEDSLPIEARLSRQLVECLAHSTERLAVTECPEMMDYDDYICVFNTGDDALLLERFFDENVTFSGGARTYQGKAALRGFLDWAHDGVREVMRPQNVLQGEDLLFAEIDMDFHASKERPEFPFGPLRPGDLVTVKFFVTYTVRDGKVVELKSMTWPPGRGVTQLPRLGAHPSQVAAFHAYCAAFSNAEFERFSMYYTKDVRLELGSVPPILGRQGILDFYR